MRAALRHGVAATIIFEIFVITSPHLLCSRLGASLTRNSGRKPARCVGMRGDTCRRPSRLWAFLGHQGAAMMAKGLHAPKQQGDPGSTDPDGDV